MSKQKASPGIKEVTIQYAGSNVSEITKRVRKAFPELETKPTVIQVDSKGITRLVFVEPTKDLRA